MKKRMKWIIPSALLVALIIAMVSLATTGAWFSDTNEVDNNLLSAATLQLSVDDNPTSGGTFSVSNIAPGFQHIKVWKIQNTGSIAGYLDIQNIEWTGTDGLDDDAALQRLLGGKLFVSTNNSSWFEADDVTLYSGQFNGMAANYDANIAIPAGGIKYIVLQMNWWSTSGDNAGQGDTLELDLDFELAQTTGQ